MTIKTKDKYRGFTFILKSTEVSEIIKPKSYGYLSYDEPPIPRQVTSLSLIETQAFTDLLADFNKLKGVVEKSHKFGFGHFEDCNFHSDKNYDNEDDFCDCGATELNKLTQQALESIGDWDE